MNSLIDEHYCDYGVEPICRILPIARSTYHERAAQRRDPFRLSLRAQRDTAMTPEVQRVSMPTLKSMACATCGGRCSVQALTLHDAQ